MKGECNTRLLISSSVELIKILNFVSYIGRNAHPSSWFKRIYEQNCTDFNSLSTCSSNVVLHSFVLMKSETKSHNTRNSEGCIWYPLRAVQKYFSLILFHNSQPLHAVYNSQYELNFSIVNSMKWLTIMKQN